MKSEGKRINTGVLDGIHVFCRVCSLRLESIMSADCNPYRRELSDNLEHDALRIFCTVSMQQQLLCRAPPVLPKGGSRVVHF